MSNNKHFWLKVLIVSVFLFNGIHITSAEEKNNNLTKEKLKKNSKELDLKKVKLLIDQGKPQQALELMEPFVDQKMGDTNFDYYYGMAAADSGDSVRAIFALERVLVQNPDFAGARLELARALYQHKELQKAKIEFESVLALNPPKTTKKLVQEYLDRIEGRQSDDNRRWIAQVGLAMGQDSNANAATSQQDFLGFDLDSQSKATASPYSHLKTNFVYDLEIVPNHDALFSAQYDTRSNTEAAFADTANFGLNAAMQHKLKSTLINYGLSYNATQVAGAENNNTFALTASVGDLKASGESTVVYLRYANIRYIASLSNQDVDQILGGVSSTNNIGDKSKQYTWSLIFGADTAVEDTSPNSKLTFGGKIAAKISFNPQLNFSAGTGVLLNAYDGKFFGISRTDTAANLDLTLNYLLGKSWLLKTGYASVNNNSTVSLYQYDKNYFYLEATWTY